MHINHLYENYLLTFAEIKDILRKASNGSLKVFEKTDGQNIFLSYSIKKNTILCARTKNDIRSGGILPKDLIERFNTNSSVRQTFKNAMKDWEKTISLITKDVKYEVFGYDADIFYNCEIQDPDTKNVINYDTKYIVIHPNGHIEMDKETGETIQRNWSANIDLLQRNLKEVEASGNSFDYKIISKTIFDIQKTMDKKHLEEALKRIDDVRSDAELNDSHNIYDLLFKKIGEKIVELAPNIDAHSKSELTKKVLGIQTRSDIPTIMKSLMKEPRAKIKDLLSNSSENMKECVKELEEIIYDFSVHMLSGLQSIFILDNDKEVKRIRQKVAQAIDVIKKSQDPQAMYQLQKQLKRLKDVNNIDTAIEGLVFDYNGKTYKFTGNFSPVNQILGLLTYGKVNFAKKIDYSPKKNIVLFPGKFKPPHAGHFMGVKEYAKNKNIDKVLVIISVKEVDGITAEVSKSIWEIFKKYEPKIEIQISQENSPIHSVFEAIKTVEYETKVFLALSEKELSSGKNRFKDIEAYAKKYNPSISVEVALSEQNNEGITGTYVRQLIKSGNEEGFYSSLPKELTSEDKKTIWDIVNRKIPPVQSEDVRSAINEALFAIRRK